MPGDSVMWTIERMTQLLEEFRDSLEPSEQFPDLVSALRAEGVLDKRLFVTPEEHQAQWGANWPDFHPETYCQRCFCRNIQSWYVDNPLWNATELRGSEIVCPQCFTELHAEATGDWQTWEIRPAQRSNKDLSAAIFTILEGNPHASKEFLAHRIAIEIVDRDALAEKVER